MGKISKKLTKAEVIARVEKGGNTFKNLPSEFKNDKDIVLAAINVWPHNFEHASKKLRKDKKIVKTAFKLSNSTFIDADNSLKKDHKFLKDLEKISDDIWMFTTTPEYEKEKKIKASNAAHAKKKQAERDKKWHLDYKLKLKRSYSHLYQFFFKNYFLMINLYAGGACCDIKDPIKDKTVNTFIGDDHFKFNKPIKTKNALRFSTGRDMHYHSYLYVDKKGKVKKVFIETTPDLRDLVSERLELVYNDQFVYKLAKADKNIIKSLNIYNIFRKQIGEVEITSGFIQIGHRSYKKTLGKEVAINYRAKGIDKLESFILPVKNKKYPVYAYVYYFDDEDEKEENIIIVVEDIEGCIIKNMDKKKMVISKILK